MRITEISNQDKLFLAIKGIQYSFDEDYKNIIDAHAMIGNSINRRNILLGDINVVCSNIRIFLEQNFQEIDSDIISAKEIYNKLLEIRNKL